MRCCVRVESEILRMDSPRFRQISEAMLAGGSAVRFRANGLSMQPNILDGDAVTIVPVSLDALRVGKVVLAETDEQLKLHRITSINRATAVITTRGDASMEDDLPASKILGQLLEIERDGRVIRFSGRHRIAQHTAARLARRLRLAFILRWNRLVAGSTSATR
jgi:hypothetical protein